MSKIYRHTVAMTLALTVCALFASSTTLADNAEMPTPMPSPSPKPLPFAYREAVASGFEPTVLDSMDEARQLFYGMVKLAGGETQCHQRAMYWSYEMFMDQKINSMKVFVYYSGKFQETFKKRRKFWKDSDYKWWYHTAPYVFVKDGKGGLMEVVLDRTFMDEPVTVHQWTHHFVAVESLNYVKSGDRKYMPELTEKETRCRVLANYRDLKAWNNVYAKNEKRNEDYIDEAKGYGDTVRRRLEAHAQEPWCFVRKVPMFYMQPNSVEAKDCDPNRDSWNGNYKRLNDGRLKFPCRNEIRDSFYDQPAAADVISAYDEVASEREHKWVKRILGPYAKRK